jgi:crossover junction endodeoxyribonuclease RusA
MRPIIKKHRDLAYAEALNAAIPVPDEGDIEIRVEFYPPNKRGDRINFPNRMKPYFDGIADALRVNDSRFLPTYVFGEPGAGCVVVTIDG